MKGIELPGLGVDGPIGLITYMRTDSVRVADEALVAVRDHIKSTFGDDYLPEKANVYKTKSDAQDAHEAIRPTSMQYDPETVRPYLTQDQYSLYRLIWNRFVASQMTPATFDETTVDVTAGDYLFRVKGTVPKFAGWMATYGLTPEEGRGEPGESRAEPGPGPPSRRDEDEASVSGVLPPLAEGDRLELKALRPEQKFTQPPPRFTEATLVKELEENGIGRPSTYASIIGVLQDRDYAIKIEGQVQADGARPDHQRSAGEELRRHHRRRVHAQPRGRSRQDRAGQDRLRQDARGVLQEVQEGSAPAPARRCRTSRKGIKTDEICERCGSPMVIKVGKFGPFVACSAYPECTNTRELEKSEPESESGEEEIEPCENCGKPMVVKRGRFGQFLACTGYPGVQDDAQADRDQAGRPQGRRSRIRFSTRSARAAARTW